MAERRAEHFSATVCGTWWPRAETVTLLWGSFSWSVWGMVRTRLLSQKCRALGLCEQSANGGARAPSHKPGITAGKDLLLLTGRQQSPRLGRLCIEIFETKGQEGGPPPNYRVQLEGDPCPMSPRGELLVSRLRAPTIVGEVIITASERSETRRRAVKFDSKRSFTSTVSVWPKPEMTASFHTTY